MYIRNASRLHNNQLLFNLEPQCLFEVESYNFHSLLRDFTT